MKKLFTIVALLACFLGAKAEWKVDKSIDFSTYTGFPHYVMGYVPEWVDGVMTDLGGMYEYAKEENEFSTGESTTCSDGTVYYRLNKQPGDDGNISVWHQYFVMTGIPTEQDGSCTVKAMVKASEEVTIPVNLRWSWNENPLNQDITIGTEWQEVEWSYTGIGGTSCDLIAQPNTAAVIEWKTVSVSHFEKEEQVEWINIIENGDAEGEYGEVACAYSKEWGTEMTTPNNDAVDHPMTPTPHIAPIEADPADGGNKVFACHAKAVEPELIFESDGTYSWGATWSAGESMPHNTWQNQFWIVFPKSLKSGEEVQVSFRYKASAALTVSTQYHTTNPGDYLSGGSIGNLDFDTDWKTYSEKLTGSDNWGSIAFNVTGENNNWQSDYDFYFDDLKLEIQKLEEGYFVAGTYTEDAERAYDFENSISFVEEGDLLVATVGDENDENTWVNQVMISTARGTDKGYKANTLKVSGTVVSDEDVWLPYEAAGQAKIDLPVRGVWKISIDTTEGEEQMNFLKLAGDADLEPIDIIMNSAELVTNATAKNGAPDWNNQFWIMANREFKGSEQTVLEFEYCVESEDAIEARVTTQWHSATPGDYKGETNQPLTFTNEWQPAKMELNPGAGIQSFCFNMACEETGYIYKIRNVKWYQKDDVLNPDGQTYENYIKAEGEDGFYVKVDGGDPVRYDQQSGEEEFSPYDIDKNGSVTLSDVRKIIIKWKDGEEGYNLAFARKAIIEWKNAQ